MVTHFFKKSPVVIHNRAAVENLLGKTGNLTHCEANFTGNGKNMKWPGVKTLLVKVGSKVMLVWNKTDRLRNGSREILKVVHDAWFGEDVVSVAIKRET